jgi:Na+-driven multidrug efflux pump
MPWWSKQTHPMDEKIRKVILHGPIGRALCAPSMPIILGNLLQTGYQLTDAFWVGRLGASAVPPSSSAFQ